MNGGLRPCRLNPINRGCVNELVYLVTNEDGSWVDLTGKRFFLTAKTQPWDDDSDDSDAIFKIEGTLPDAVNEPGRVVFTISEKDSYQDPTVPYFCDIVSTGQDGTSNANRVFIGEFEILPGPNNAQAGGEEDS